MREKEREDGPKRERRLEGFGKGFRTALGRALSEIQGRKEKQRRKRGRKEKEAKAEERIEI